MNKKIIRICSMIMAISLMLLTFAACGDKEPYEKKDPTENSSLTENTTEEENKLPENMNPHGRGAFGGRSGQKTRCDYG